MQDMSQAKAALLRRGVMVFVGLAVLTALEYWVAIALHTLSLLAITGLAKAALIVEYYMHLRAVWQDEEGGH